MRRRLAAILAAALPALAFACPAGAAPQTYTVTNTNDSGAGSLRQAITDANANAGRDRIEFDIPGAGPHTITPASDLPGLTDSVIVDGKTQPGYAGKPLIALDGSAAVLVGTSSGLAVGGPNSVVSGLSLVGWEAVAVRMQAANGVFRGNYVGVLPDGVTGQENFSGVAVGGDNVTVGGTTPADRNVIAGGFYFSVGVFSGSGVKILGNRIGTNANGTAALESASAGVLVSGGENLTIGAPAAGNLISGNGAGIFVQTAGGAPAVRIRGNRIGTNAAGTGGIPNGIGVRFDGSLFGDAPGPVAPGTAVGGVAAGFGNVIAYNTVGVMVRGAPTDVPVRGNSLFANTGLAVDLENDGVTLNDALDADDGGNGLQNFPQIASVRRGKSGTTIRGTLASTPSTTYKLDFYRNSACDPTGFGEGKRHLGTATVTTNAQGKTSFAKKVASKRPGIVTATATGPAGVTSELSLCSPTPAYAVDVASDQVDADLDDFLCRTAAGKCTLRAAIEQANARPGRDRIRFAIPGGGVQTVEPQSPLPDVTDPLVVDATTQRGFRREPLIELVGTNAGADVEGLRAVGGGLLVKGLAITRFDGDGIVVASGRGNVISRNSIRSNGGLGIDLGDDGVTLNDPRDRDAGPNGRQNYPVIAAARRGSGRTTVSGNFASRPNRTYRLEFFLSPACDPSQVGEGAKYLGAATVRTSGGGSARFTKGFPTAAPVGHVVTATATGRDGTSELSVCRRVTR